MFAKHPAMNFLHNSFPIPWGVVGKLLRILLVQRRLLMQVAKSNFRNGGANLPVCRDDPQVVAHLFGNLFWQLL